MAFKDVYKKQKYTEPNWTELRWHISVQFGSIVLICTRLKIRQPDTVAWYLGIIGSDLHSGNSSTISDARLPGGARCCSLLLLLMLLRLAFIVAGVDTCGVTIKHRRRRCAYKTR